VLYSKGPSAIPKSLPISFQSSTPSLGSSWRRVLGSPRLFISSAPSPKDEPAPSPIATSESSTEKSPPSDKEKTAEETALEKQLKQELSKVNTDLSNMRNKCEELEDKYKRALAESENMRTRLTKQINDQKLYAIQGFCKDLTDIEDILHLAIESVPKDQIKENKNLATLYEGLKMTEARMLKVFQNHGLVQLNPMNAKFNPNEHEAVLQKEEPGIEAGTVILVSKLGYKLHERVIRPAIVGVAK